MNEPRNYKASVGGKTIEFEFNKFAKQATSSVMVSCGDTQVLVAVTSAPEAKEGQDFLPLTVDYIEKFYSAGKIPGGYLKREAKPTDQEILIARLTDRPLRPSFPKGFYKDTFVTIYVLSYDQENSPSSLGLIGASAALTVSDIPFNGPIAALLVGLKADGSFCIDPSIEEREKLDLRLAASEDAVLMVEAGAQFLPEKKMLEAIDFGWKAMNDLFKVQNQMREDFGLPKQESPSPYGEYKDKLFADDSLVSKVKEAFNVSGKQERNQMLSSLEKEVEGTHLAEDCSAKDKILFRNSFDALKSSLMRKVVTEQSKRIDGRQFDEIRPIACEVGVLKRSHGSALFTRGETQALGVVTLGAGDDAQRLDSIRFEDERKKFLLHYNFPPFCVGEARPARPPGRREIGHGALAERALIPALPDDDDFSYTIRMVSEVLESNGSSSMATVCAGTMALFAAGVPLKTSVAGIALGLVYEDDQNYAILSDILGDEDHLGDMDFKVCGNSEGISALQMDIKISGITLPLIEKALEQAKKGRLHILEKITSTIQAPKELSPFAPRIYSLQIDKERIKDLIGPGGKNIKRITAETGVKIDIEDSGAVKVIASDVASYEEAKKLIDSLTKDPDIGDVIMGTIKKVVNFGVFVEISPGTEGLCHISELDQNRIDNIDDSFSEGDEILVKVIDVDRGRIKLSRKQAQ